MKSISVALGVLLCSFCAISQNTAELTPELQRKFKLDIEKEIPALRLDLEKAKVNSVKIEFPLDTFRVEKYMDKCLDLDYSDFAMRDIGYQTAHLYDSLMNKYYKKLLNTLKGDDKKVLIQAQKAWISFRDGETKLVEAISKDEYSGGGTMQQLTESSEYLNLVKNRTIGIFEHYIRATQNY